MNKNKKGEVSLEVLLLIGAIFFIFLLATFFLLATCDPTITKETHGGHKYLVRKQALEHGSSMVHDPDCPCGKQLPERE